MSPQPASLSPSAAEHALIVAAWKEQQLPVDVIAPTPATVCELALAHNRAYVEGVLAGRVANGYGNWAPEVAAALPYATGALLSAAQYAIDHHTIACAPCSGFQHARYGSAELLSTFNSVAVTACTLRARGAAHHVGILECAMQSGDGLDDILKRVGAHRWAVHFKAGLRYAELANDAAWFAELASAVESMSGCDIVLYQAGAGAHGLTSEQRRRRDAIVFEGLRVAGVPVAWCFDDAVFPGMLEAYTDTAREALRVLDLGEGPGPSPATARAAFDAAFTNEMYRQLVTFARRSCGKHGRAASLISGEDLVHTAIEKTLDGTRRWNAGHVDLADHLRSAINSELSNGVERVAAFPEVSLEIDDDSAVAEQVAQIAMTDHRDRYAEAEAHAAALAALRDDVRGDLFARTLLVAYEDGARTREEVMVATGLTKSQYAVAYWRLMHIVSKRAKAIRKAG